MLYKDIPYHHVFMRRSAIDMAYPDECLDVSVERYQSGMMKDWCIVQVDSGHIDTMEEAKTIFHKTFLLSTQSLEECIFFLRHKNGEIVGSITLWQDYIQDVLMKRLHWLAVKDEYAKQGYANYLVAMLCALCKSEMFLSTQTWSYPAIHLYVKYGFKPWNPKQEEDYDVAWHLLDEKLKR